METDELRAGLAAALSGSGRGGAAADRLCTACVELLDFDGAALSLIHDGSISRSLGSSGSLSRELDELQFTLGEGPCLETATSQAPVFVPDLEVAADTSWPRFAEAALQRGVRSIFALPVAVGTPVGALDLYRNRPGELEAAALAGGLIAAELACLPVLDIMGIDFDAAVDDRSTSAWADLAMLTRTEVFQASGMVMQQLGVSASEAVIRIRAYAYAHGMTASEVGFAIIDGAVHLGDDRSGFEETDPS